MTTPASSGTSTATRREPFQWLALVIGVVYLLVGIVGFTITGFGDLTEHDHSQTLLGFAINPLHNIVHIIVGLLGVILWSTPARARTYGWILAVGYGATFIYGLIVANNEDGNILNINGADNGLHLVSALAGLAIALWPARDRARASTSAGTARR
jgi:fumarate reductase subunit D